MYAIIKAVPKAKRLNIADNLNNKYDNWKYNEDDSYTQKVEKEFGEIVLSCISDGIEEGAELGDELLGIPGMIIGGAIGGVVGCISGVFKAKQFK